MNCTIGLTPKTVYSTIFVGSAAGKAYLSAMKSNIEPVADAEVQSSWTVPPGARVWRVLDFSLFMYGLVRGDIFVSQAEGVPVYAGLAVWELDGATRLGIPFVERHTWLTTLSGLVTASRVEFTVDPADQPRLANLGVVVSVVQTALYFSRRSPFHEV